MLPLTALVVALVLLASALDRDPAALVRAGIGLVAARTVYWLLWRVRSTGLGFGDVRLAAPLGAALGQLGWGQLVVGLYAGFLVFGLPRPAARGGPARPRRAAHGVPVRARDAAGRAARRAGGGAGARRARGGPSRGGVTRRAAADGDERLTPCCAGSPRGSPTAPPWSRSSRGCPPTCRSPPTTSRDALARRRLGYGRGARMKFEQDEVTILGGVRHGATIGGPVAIEVGNTEWPKWEKVMSADPVDPVELEALARNAPLTRPRPGHADLVGMQKYGFDEARPVLERASRPRDRGPGRARAGGARTSSSRPSAPGSSPTSSSSAACARPPGSCPTPDDVARLDADPVRCLDPDASAAMVGRDRPGPQGRRHPRRRRRGRRPRAAARASARTCTGTAGSTPGWPAR